MDRRAVYLRDRAELTPAQRRRIKHKDGHAEAEERRADVRRALQPQRIIHLPYSRLFFTPDGGSSVELTSMVREISLRPEEQRHTPAPGMKTRVPISARNLRRLIKRGADDRVW